MVLIIAKEGVDGLHSKVCEDCCAVYHFFEGPSPMVGASPLMIDDLKEQEGVHGICGLGTRRDRAALIGFATT
jgi:hypothetical protein